MRQMIVEIGFQKYAVTPEDAITLLAISARAVAVTHTSDYTVYVREAKDDPFATKAEIAEVVEQVAVPIEYAQVQRPRNPDDDIPF